MTQPRNPFTKGKAAWHDGQRFAEVMGKDTRQQATAVTDLLRAAGWRQENIRGYAKNGSTKSYGGRYRFQKGSRYVTIGPQRVCFYRLRDGVAIDHVTLDNKQLDKIRAEMAK